MARVTKSPLIGVISGSVNGMTFRKGKDGTQVCYGKITKITNPASANQAAQRAVLAELSKDWYQTLDPTKRGVFETFAVNKYGARKQTGEGARAIIRANSGRGGGKGLYIYLNQNIMSLGGIKIDTPDPIGVLPTAPTNVAHAVDGMTHDETITWDGTAYVGPNTFVRVWIVGTGKIPHRQILGTALASLGTLTVSSVKGGTGASVLVTKLAGIPYFIQLEAANKANGLASNPSETIQAAFGI